MEIGLSALACGASLAAAAVVAACAVRAGSGRAAAAVHALMGVGMALMFSPWGDPTPPTAGAVVFGVAGAWFLVRPLRADGPPSADAVHLVIGPAAMVLMYVTGGGHARHTAGGSAGWLLSAVALALTGYFAWYAWHVLRGPAGVATVPGGTAAVRQAVGIEPGAYAVLSAVMAVMFLTGV